MSNKNERKLVKVRKSCGYKATEVCRVLGIHKNTLYQYENGLRDMRASVLKIFAELYKCKIDDLID